MIDAEFLALLACPRCESRPKLLAKGEELVCSECHYRYKVVDGIPYLLVEEAMPPEEPAPAADAIDNEGEKK